MLQTGKPSEALQLVKGPTRASLLPSWSGEYLAIRALSLACCGVGAEALETACAAEAATLATDVRVLAQAARAVANSTRLDQLRLIDLARRTEIWDPVLCALRSSRELTDALVSEEEVRPTMEELAERTEDSVLARRIGMRIRWRGQPSDLLSPREMEVLGLIARGYKNRDISHALFIADSTTKVHVRHILEKLGVRTRAEAVARLHSAQN
jgi:ATP/maltotriose-dependent transcriptional regulator MalT